MIMDPFIAHSCRWRRIRATAAGTQCTAHGPLLPLGEPSLAFVSQRPCFAFASTSVFERLAAVRAAGRHDVEDTEAELLD